MTVRDCRLRINGQLMMTPLSANEIVWWPEKAIQLGADHTTYIRNLTQASLALARSVGRHRLVTASGERNA